MFSHWANMSGVASFEMFGGVAMNAAPELEMSSVSRFNCCDVDGDRMLWSISFAFELVDETLLMPIGLATLTLVFVVVVNTASNLLMCMGECDMIGEPDPRILFESNRQLVVIIRSKRNGRRKEAESLF